MVRKYLRHFNRGLVIGFEILGVGVILFLIAWVGLIVRLAQGPLNVDFLTKSLEQSFNSGQSGFSFAAGSTILTWGGTGQPFIFEMNHVQVARADKTPVLAVDKIGVQLSKRYLIFGKVVPRVIRIYAPALRIVHGADGTFSLNVNEAAPVEAVPAAIPATPAPAVPAADQTAALKALLAQMNDRSGAGLLGRLDQVMIKDAALYYEDKVLNAAWKSKKSDLLFKRARGGMNVSLLANVDLNAEHTATVEGEVYYNWGTHQSRGTVSFVNFNPALAAQQSEQLKDLAGIDLPLQGSLSLTFDENFTPGYGRFSLGAAPGKIAVAGLYDEAIPVQSFYAQGRLNAPTGEIALEQLAADIGGPKVSATGSIIQQAEGHAVSVNATLEEMPIDKLKVYWPEKLTPDPRAWVTGHLSAGIAHKATLELAMLFPHACASPCGRIWEDFGAPTLQKVGGKIDFTGIKVDYFPPLMPVLKVNGTAHYDDKSFNLDVATGLLGDMEVTGSKIRITDLDIQSATVHSKIDISVGLKGPLKTALQVLNKEPLQYPKKLGLQTAEVEGAAKVDVNFKFPLYEKLQIEEVKVGATAQLDNVLLKGLVGDLPLSGGPLDLKLSGSALNVKGTARLATMPVTFDWTKDFAAKAKVASKVTASLPLDAPALASFGVPDDFKIAGTIPAEVTYTAGNDTSAALQLKGDVTPAGFTIPVAGYEKLPQEPGTLDMMIRFRDGRLAGIDGLSLSTAKAQIKGRMDFASDGKSFRSASFDRIQLGDTDVALSLESRGSEGYAVKVNGPQFDASKMLEDSDAPAVPHSDVDAAKLVTPLAVTMSVDKLITGKTKGIDKIRMFLRRNAWSRIDQLEVDGVAGGKPLSVRYLPTAKGHTLQFQADNAGAALSAMGVSNGVRGGRIVVNGQPNTRDLGKRNLYGSVILSDFSLVNVPVLGRLLNALSLNGIIELLNGKGIAFKKMRAGFQWIDKGPPDSEKNSRLIIVRDGQTSGASLGLTFEGSIDNWNNTYDMNGTIIPVSDINKLVSSIPLVGDILTGGGTAVFAATYKIKGAKADPSVSVNPLSVLAPGMLRKLFFEK